MSNIALSSGIRSNLLALQGTASLLETAQSRLATGKKVNSALDDAVSFFTAKGMSDRGTSIKSLTDGISTGIQTVKAASSGLDTISKLLDQAKAIAKQFKTATTDAQTDLAAQYDDIKTQINQAAKDASVNGVNLLKGDDAGAEATKLTVTFDEDNTDSKIDLKGQEYTTETAGKLALGTLTDTASVDTELTAISTAVTAVKSKQSSLGTSLSILSTRADFNKNLANILQVGSDNLVNADQNEEAANVLALQTRQSLSQSALSLANQANQSVLQLLR